MDVFCVFYEADDLCVERSKTVADMLSYDVASKFEFVGKSLVDDGHSRHARRIGSRELAARD